MPATRNSAARPRRRGAQCVCSQESMTSPRPSARSRFRPVERHTIYLSDYFKRRAPMRGRDLLSISDLSPEELDLLIRTALSMKRDGSRPVPPGPPGQTIPMPFEKPSLRTRVSFEVGMKQLGGSAIYLSQSEVGLGQREPVAGGGGGRRGAPPACRRAA